MVSAGRLLVAERDPELLELMVPVLRLAGHRVTAARDLGYAENLGSGLENIEGTACAFRDETGAPVGVLSTIYDRDGSRDGRREDTGRLNRLYAHSISRSLGFRDPN